MNINRLEDGMYISINPGFTKITGYTEKDIIGKTSIEYNIWDNIEDRKKLVAGLKKDGEVINLEAAFRMKNGKIRYGLMSASLIDLSGVPHILNITRDITDRKQVESQREAALKALRESEENFRLSLDNSPLGVRIVTAAGETIYANRAILDIYNYDSVEELEKIPLKQRYTPESYADFQIRNEKRRRGEFGPSEYEINIVRKNGEIRHLHVFRKEVIWNGAKQFQVIYHDITEQKRIEKELKKSEEKYWLTFSSTSDVIFTVDSELRISDITPSVEKILGYKPEELLNQPFKNLNLMTLESMERAITNVMRILSGEEIPITVYEFITKDGIRAIGEITGSPLIQENKIIGVTCVADVTERKRAEEEREKLQAQLLQSQKMESVGRLAGGIAHDFNNILTTILGRTALAMQRCKPTGPIHAHLQAIEKSTLRSADLIRQLLAFARKQTVAPKVLDLNDTVANMLKIIQPLIGEDIDFAWIPGASVWLVKIDPSRSTNFWLIFASMPEMQSLGWARSPSRPRTPSSTMPIVLFIMVSTPENM